MIIIPGTDDGCGEGPIWDVEQGRLLWADVSRKLVHQLFLDSHATTGLVEVISRDVMVSGMAAGSSGELVFAGEGGLHVWEARRGAHPLLVEHEGRPLCFNDILADPAGRVYAGTYYWGPGEMLRRGALYLIARSPDPGTPEALDVRVVDDGFELSNGLGLSPDDRILYCADSTARKIHAYDVNPRTGELSRKRVFVTVPGDEGIPDGLTVDSEGFVWSAQWYGGQVVRYDPDGAVERRIELPVKQVASLAFGGHGLEDLFITTASDPWPSGYAPPGYDFASARHGGPLYRTLSDGVKGKPEHRARLV